MKSPGLILCVGACSLALPAFSRVSGNGTEKIVFVRPDPVITTASSGVRLSGDTRASDSKGGVKLNSVDDPGMLYHAHRKDEPAGHHES